MNKSKFLLCGLAFGFLTNSCLASVTAAKTVATEVAIAQEGGALSDGNKGKAKNHTAEAGNKNAVVIKDYDSFVNGLTDKIIAELKAKKIIQIPEGKPEEIEGAQGSFKVSPAETAIQEAKEWSSTKGRPSEVKAGFFKVPGTNTSIRLYGFAFLTGVYTIHDAAAGYTADYSLFPDRLAPRNIHAGKKKKTDFNMLANESRMGIETFSLANIGECLVPLKTVIEFDFSNGENGSSSLSKDYELNLRHAYFSFGNVLLGQTTTTFADPAASAETTNGPSGSSTKRTVQIRYVWDLGNGSEARVAIEKNIDKFVDLSGTGEHKYALNDSTKPSHEYHSSSAFPTLVVSAKRAFDSGHIGGALALRHISLNSNDWAPKHLSKLAVCGRISGSLNFLQNDSVFGIATYGQAPGYYISDYKETIFVTEDKIKALRALGLMGGIRHFWTQHYKVRSTLALGYVRVHNDKYFANKALFDGNAAIAEDGRITALPREVVKSLFSATFNVMMSLLPNLEMGLEYSYGSKKVTDGRRGVNHAIIFSARLDF